VLLEAELTEGLCNVTNTVTIPKHIAEAVLSPRAHSERDALLSNQRWLRANNPVGLVEADGYDPFWLLTRHQDVYEVGRQNSLTGAPKRSASTFVGGPKTLPVRFVLR
jgi:hypothetical protein